MSVPVLLNVCNESCSNKIGLPTTLYEHVNGFQRAGEIYRLLSLYHHGFVSLNMEMPSRFRGILHPLNGTTGIAQRRSGPNPLSGELQRAAVTASGGPRRDQSMGRSRKKSANHQTQTAQWVHILQYLEREKQKNF